MNQAVELTVLLRAWAAGDDDAEAALFAEMYPRLRRLARSKLRGEVSARPMDATELVHEVYIRLVHQRQIDWRSRDHFFAMAATVIRRVLVDQARRRQSCKRGSGAVHVSLAEANLPHHPWALDLLALDRALADLAAIRQTAARVVELRFFAGLSIEDTATTLHVGRTTVIRQWRFARAWLTEQLLGTA